MKDSSLSARKLRLSSLFATTVLCAFSAGFAFAADDDHSRQLPSVELNLRALDALRYDSMPMAAAAANPIATASPSYAPIPTEPGIAKAAPSQPVVRSLESQPAADAPVADPASSGDPVSRIENTFAEAPALRKREQTIRLREYSPLERAGFAVENALSDVSSLFSGEPKGTSAGKASPLQQRREPSAQPHTAQEALAPAQVTEETMATRQQAPELTAKPDEAMESQAAPPALPTPPAAEIAAKPEIAAAAAVPQDKVQDTTRETMAKAAPMPQRSDAEILTPPRSDASLLARTTESISTGIGDATDSVLGLFGMGGDKPAGTESAATAKPPMQAPSAPSAAKTAGADLATPPQEVLLAHVSQGSGSSAAPSPEALIVPEEKNLATLPPEMSGVESAQAATETTAPASAAVSASAPATASGMPSLTKPSGTKIVLSAPATPEEATAEPAIEPKKTAESAVETQEETAAPAPVREVPVYEDGTPDILSSLHHMQEVESVLAEPRVIETPAAAPVSNPKAESLDHKLAEARETKKTLAPDAAMAEKEAADKRAKAEAEKEKAAKAEAEKIAKQKAAQEAAAKAEAEKAAQEAAAKAQAEKAAQEAAAKAEAEKAAQEAAAKAEAEKAAQEAAAKPPLPALPPLPKPVEAPAATADAGKPSLYDSMKSKFAGWLGSKEEAPAAGIKPVPPAAPAVAPAPVVAEAPKPVASGTPPIAPDSPPQPAKAAPVAPVQASGNLPPPPSPPPLPDIKALSGEASAPTKVEPVQVASAENAALPDPAKLGVPQPPPPPLPAPANIDAPSASGGTSSAHMIIVYNQTETAVPLTIQQQLSGLAGELKTDEQKRVVLVAYASAPPEQASTARRVALARALAVRTYLIEQGISNLRITVQAEGNKNSGGDPDRVDVFVRQANKS